MLLNECTSLIFIGHIVDNELAPAFLGHLKVVQANGPLN